jgi:mitogen-activated protein kinase 15
MKPANLLLNSECLMKVADFGLARSLLEMQDEGGQEPRVMTDYVATRWYRAPEILAGSTSYGVAVDMWSLGCIFAEMIGGKPVFAGTSTLNQFEKIVEVLGAPSDSDVRELESAYAKTMLDSISLVDHEPKTNEQQKQAWARIFPSASPEAIDCLMQLMQFSPKKRMTSEAGLTHPYCSQFHDQESEIVARYNVNVEVPQLGSTGGLHKVDDNKKVRAHPKPPLRPAVGTPHRPTFHPCLTHTHDFACPAARRTSSFTGIAFMS